MFENLTLADQRRTEEARGWKPHFRALTYCTAEAVLFRRPTDTKSILDYEVLDAERISGAPDCVGKRQGKWGTYIYPTDKTAEHAILRALKELFAWDIPHSSLQFAGVVGPWLHKATARLEKEILYLRVLDEQAEETPFEAKLFFTDVTSFDLSSTNAYLKICKDLRWVRFKELIKTQGQNKNYLYWQMIAMCAERALGYSKPFRYFEPSEGECAFHLT